MTNHTIAIAVAAFIGLSGCGAREVETPNASTMAVTKHEDCTVFLTKTGGFLSNHVYWVRCKANGDVPQTKTLTNCGKSCIRNVTVETVK